MTDVDAKRVQRVEDILLEMKDTSELMVDLAYSCVFYTSKTIAQEVDQLEETMGRQLTDLQRTSLEAVQAGEMDIDHALVLIRVAQAAELIANSALEIADVVLRDVEMHPVMAEAIRASDSAITKVSLEAGSPFADQRLRDIELESETGMRVLAVRRDGRWHSGVEGDFALHAADLIVAVGPAEALHDFEAACAPAAAQSP